MISEFQFLFSKKPIIDQKLSILTKLIVNRKEVLKDI